MKFFASALFLNLVFGLLNSYAGPKPTPPIKKMAGIEKTPFGQFPDGREADLFTLRNAAGMTVKITNYGGYIVSMTAPDKSGNYEDIILGMPTFADYLKGTPSLGPIIGRFGNRIGGAKFTLDGKEYVLAANNRGNQIHGGRVGFDKKLWNATPVDGNEPTLKLTYTSADGEEGYPGNLAVEVDYTLQKDNSLRITYQATTDKPTVLNLTNHAYFNLSGMKRDVLGYELMIKANTYLPTDARQIPTGEIQPVKGTPFDFTKPTVVGSRINDTTNIQIKYGSGYDHCWVLGEPSNKLRLGATVYDPESGRLMTMYTTEPGVQVYTANHLNGLKGKDGVAYTKRFGICLETQHFPDSPNKPNFPSTVLRPGETYRSTTVYNFAAKK